MLRISRHSCGGSGSGSGSATGPTRGVRATLAHAQAAARVGAMWDTEVGAWSCSHLVPHAPSHV